MIRLLLALSTLFWLCLFTWPLETLAVYVLVVTAVARATRVDEPLPRAEVRRG